MAIEIQKTYLGDGAYADFEHGMIKLTAENGIMVTDTIYLESGVYDALKRFGDEIEAEIAIARKKAMGDQS